MSKQKKEQVIRVDNLVIHAKEVKIVTDKDHNVKQGRHEKRRDPWGMLLGSRSIENEEDTK